jgi:uncharacterized protein (TIGR00369 family)
MKTEEALIRRAIETLIPFNQFLGIKVKSIERGKVTLVLPFRSEFIGDPTRPALHGGVLSTLIDMAGGAAVWTELEETDRIATVDLLVDYLMPAAPATISADARISRIGNRVAVARITVYQEGLPEAIAEGRAVYNIVRAKSKRGNI